MNLFFPILALVLASLGLAWFFIPIFTGIPWVPSKDIRIRCALELANLQPGETLADLGCGDGRVLITAVRDFGARAIGIEISPLHCLVAWLRIRAAGLGKQISIRNGNYYQYKLEHANVVYQYGHSMHNEKLKRYLEGHLRSGARHVNIGVELTGWQPDAANLEHLIFLYRMPARQGDLAGYLLERQS